MAKYMIHTCTKRLWYVENYLIPSMLEQGIDNHDITLYVDVNDGCLKSHVKSFTQASDYNIKGMWHLQDDVIICKDFKEQTEKYAGDFTVCGFASEYDERKGWKDGDVTGLNMWYSFPCIYIPTRIVKSYTDWFNVYVWRDHQYDKWVKANKYDDTIFRIYMENYYKDEYVLNLAPNLVDHIDYLIGGTIINEAAERKHPIRSLYWQDEDLVQDLERRLKDDIR